MTSDTRLERIDSAARDFIGWILFRTGVAWLTPFIGVVDFSDLDQLRGQMQRDLLLLNNIRRDLAETDGLALQKIDGVRESLEQMLCVIPSRTGPSTATVRPVRWPWHASRGWADFGAVRAAFYACLPPAVWTAALYELGNMKPLLFTSAQRDWAARLDRLREVVATVPLTAASREQVPYDLQSLWHEVNYARDKKRRRVVKQTTIVQITWAVLVIATSVLAALLHGRPRATGVPDAGIVIVFGLLGGTVSALRTVDFVRLKDRSPVEIEAVRLRLRPVLGGSVALVTYALAGLGLVSVTGTAADFPVQIVVANTDRLFWTYCVIGFMAGFSERWFLAFLDSGLGSGSSADPTESPDGSGAPGSETTANPAPTAAPSLSRTPPSVPPAGTTSPSHAARITAVATPATPSAGSKPPPA